MIPKPCTYCSAGYVRARKPRSENTVPVWNHSGNQSCFVALSMSDFVIATSVKRITVVTPACFIFVTITGACSCALVASPIVDPVAV